MPIVMRKLVVLPAPLRPRRPTISERPTSKETPDTTVRDPGLAARMVVQTVEALTHRLVLYPPHSTSTRRVSDEIAELVVRYLTAAS